MAIWPRRTKYVTALLGLRQDRKKTYQSNARKPRSGLGGRQASRQRRCCTSFACAAANRRRAWPSTGLGLRLSRVLDRGHRGDLAAMAWVARGPRVHRPPRRPFGAKARPLPGTDPLGGGRGIRTLDTVSRIHAFQACAFSRSATPPAPAGCRIRAHYSQGGEADNSQSRRVRRKSPALRDDPGIKQATRSRNAAAPGLAVAIDSWCPCASGL